MYVSKHFAERDLNVLHDSIEESRFGVLVLCGDGPLAAHIPFVLERDAGPRGTLRAHVARADPLARQLGAGAEALAIFGGPKAYVSPRWLAHGGLPTYNYVAVHAHGTPAVLAEPSAVWRHLGELAEVHERERARTSTRHPSAAPWSIEDAEPGLVERLLEHIVAFELPIASIQGKRKLSQNRSAENRAAVISGLRDGGGEDQVAIAELMAGYLYDSDVERSLVSDPER